LDSKDHLERLVDPDLQVHLDFLEQLDCLVHLEVPEVREALVLPVLLEQLAAQVRRASTVLPDHRDPRVQLE